MHLCFAPRRVLRDNGSLRRLSSPSARDVECAELNFVVMFAKVQGVEIRDAINVQDDGLAIEHTSLLANLASGLNDPVIKRPARTSPKTKTSA